MTWFNRDLENAVDKIRGLLSFPWVDFATLSVLRSWSGVVSTAPRTAAGRAFLQETHPGRSKVGRRPSEDTERSGVPQRPLTGRRRSSCTMRRAAAVGRLPTGCLLRLATGVRGDAVRLAPGDPHKPEENHISL